MDRHKKTLLNALLYFLCLTGARFLYTREEYIYGHEHEYKFLEFAGWVILVPAGVFLWSLARKGKMDRAAGLAVLVLFAGFLSLLASTFIEKTVVRRSLKKDGILTLGTIEQTYTTRRRSGSPRYYYQFVVAFQYKNTFYYSLPGFTEEPKYNTGDTIPVLFLARNPFLNEIYYSKESTPN